MHMLCIYYCLCLLLLLFLAADACIFCCYLYLLPAAMLVVRSVIITAVASVVHDPKTSEDNIHIVQLSEKTLWIRKSC